jgi:tetratricopeptide (TPR) repeat protein
MTKKKLTDNKVSQKKGKSTRFSHYRVFPPMGIRNIVIGILIAVYAFLIFKPSLNNGFAYDDSLYIEKNQQITDLSLGGISKIFSSYVAGNYHPLTILTLAIDFHAFKHDPYGFHLMNLIFHGIATFLIFIFIFRLTDDLITASVVSLLFGIHPMHVESVSWISGRKDLLYTCFFILSLIFYLYYQKEKGIKGFYILSLIFFIFSCLSKAMATVLPIALILIDYYKGVKFDKKVILEKVPFFVISIIIGLIAIKAQNEVGSFISIPYSIPERIMLAFYGLFFYIEKMFVPLGLSAIYTYPERVNNSLPLIVMLSPLIILILTLLIIKFKSKLSRLTILGSLFYVLCLLQVLQIQPVGDSFAADRYFYLSSIGLFLIIGSGISFIFKKYRDKLQYIKNSVIFVSVVAFVLLSILTYQRTYAWQNNYTLYTNVIENYPNAKGAYFGLAKYYKDNKDYSDALKMLNKTLELDPRHNEAYYNLGNLYYELKQYDKSIDAFNKSIEINPRYSKIYTNLGSSYIGMNDYINAEKSFKTAIQINSNDYNAYNNLGIIYYKLKRVDESIEMLNNAIKIKPDFLPAYIGLSQIYQETGNIELAREYSNKAGKIKAEMENNY